MAETAFGHFMGRQQARAVRFLERNESINGFVAALIDHMTTYCEREGVTPEQIEIDMPFVSQDGVVQARIRKR
jgi:hypothetical protein